VGHSSTEKTRDDSDALIWSGMLAHSAKQTGRVNAFGGERGRFGADRGAVGERNKKGCVGRQVGPT
jgi:hypothetical protein